MESQLSSGREAVKRLAAEQPEWVPAVRAALTLAESGRDVFPGASIVGELRRQQAARTWYPNFRPLATYGVVEKAGRSTRGGSRAYYRIPDLEGVRQGLRDLEATEGGARTYPDLSFTGIGRSGRSDLSERAEEILCEEFPND